MLTIAPFSSRARWTTGNKLAMNLLGRKGDCAVQQILFWAYPVKVGLGGGTEQIIRGPADALRLLSDWPTRGGWFFERARNRCHAALEMSGDVELARQAFLAASLEASVPFA